LTTHRQLILPLRRAKTGGHENTQTGIALHAEADPKADTQADTQADSDA
jgi:hypothetical protein